VAFAVATGGGGGGGSVVGNAQWTAGGAVQAAVGRIYFEMPANSRKTKWNGYVCSGTVVNDGTQVINGGVNDVSTQSANRSIILTASHCVYDDAYKAFARNVLFIPDQAGTSGTGTDRNCDNDPYGCWAPAFGVVDVDWTTRTFPDNVAWDYAFYVVNNGSGHSGSGTGTVLDTTVTPLPLDFNEPEHDVAGAYTHALGYSYSDDPNFMYCAEDMQTESADDWWLPSCGLSGGSSGGPWVQPMDAGAGSGPIISVNSWGYTNQPGMAGPLLWGSSAECLFGQASGAALGTTGLVISNTTCTAP
jgi:hypothetical protein